MTPGIPGVGLGGLFFVFSALLALVFELARTVRGESSLARWRFVGRQAAIAASIILSTTATLWVFELVLLKASKVTSYSGGAGSGGAKASAGWLGGPAAEALERVLFAASPILLTLTFLALVLVCTETLRLVLRRPALLSGESTPEKESS